MGSNSVLRGAIIGLGNVALHGHLPGWRGRRDVAIVAASDAHAAQRAECLARLPGARWHDSAEALLAAESVDFVDICTPPSSHAALIRRALEGGVHVLCEKPLVGSLAEVRALARLAEEAGAVLHTVHNWHYAPIIRATAALIREGRIGQVREVVWQTLRAQPAATAARGDNWRLDPAVAGGGVLTDHGWHVAYVVQRWVGAAPTAVRARLETRRHHRFPVEDTATVRLRFPHAGAEILLTWAADERRNWARVTGTAGRIEIEDDTLVLSADGGERRWPCPPALSNGSQHPDWFAAVTDEFVARVTGAAADGTNLAEATVCVAVEAAARESSQRGGEEVVLPGTEPVAVVSRE